MTAAAFSTHDPRDIDGILHAECLRGSQAPDGARPDLLVEVPHGADRRSDYDRVREMLVGDLPPGLEKFFHVNTDVGAWDYGVATAHAFLERAPKRTVLLVRCLLPRTFVDCNRPAGHRGGDLTAGALTAGIPDYVANPRDRERLGALHGQYVRAVETAYRDVCGGGGLALTPHTYAPRSVGITSVGDDIVDRLHWAYEPERYETWPLRPEIDLLTRDGDGCSLAPPGIEERLLEAFTRAGREPRANDTYHLAPGSLGAHWSGAFPGQVLCLEVRRDLLVREWRPFDPMAIDAGAVAAVAGVLGPALVRAVEERTGG